MEPDLTAIGPRHAVFMLIRAPQRQTDIERGKVGLGVFGVNQSGQVVKVAWSVGCFQSQQGGPTGVVVQGARGQGPIPHAFADHVLHIAQLPFARFCPLLGLANVGDVIGNDQDLQIALRIAQRLLERLVVTRLTRSDIRRIFVHHFRLEAAHDALYVAQVKRHLLSVGVEGTVVLADQGFWRRAIEVCQHLVRIDEPTVPVLHQNDVAAFIRHGAKENVHGCVIAISATGHRSRGQAVGRR